MDSRINQTVVSVRKIAPVPRRVRFRRVRTRALAALLAASAVLVATTARAARGPREWALTRLDYARAEKVRELRRFCQRARRLAADSTADAILVNCFRINRALDTLEKAGKQPPPELAASVAKLRAGLTHHYLGNYLTFYDILFVAPDGRVFLTMRNESDLHTDLITEEHPENPLAACLRSRPRELTFVDFHLYGPSGEAAAFLVQPLYDDSGASEGWFVFQTAINKINSIFAWTDDLGQTGETFLVNRRGYMLTESNFRGAPTILRKRLDNRNIQAKFAEGAGHRSVVDYRNFRALTSFEVFPFLGADWLVVAKVDHDDVVSRHYCEHRRYYEDRILASLQERTPRLASGTTPAPCQKLHRVDMDEFVRAEADECLHTFGVSTCTAVLAFFPGKFAYLGHISPRDRIYGETGTNILGRMLKRIASFDIYPSERRRLVFVIAAPHLNGVPGIVDKLIEEGILLSQIRLAFNPDAETASLRFAPHSDGLLVRWRQAGDSAPTPVQGIEHTISLGQLLEELMREDDDAEREGRRTTSQTPATPAGNARGDGKE